MVENIHILNYGVIMMKLGRKYWNKFLNLIIPNRSKRLLSKMMEQDQELGLYKLNKNKDKLC